MNDATIKGTVQIDGVPTEVTVVFKQLVPAPTAPPAPPTPVPTAPPAPAPPPIPLGSWSNVFLQTGGYWVEEGIWGAGALTQGPYTGLAGTTYEQQVGVSPHVGPAGEVAWGVAWKWPTGTAQQEVKAFPSILCGAKPGLFINWIGPGGKTIILPDGSVSQTSPSGPTPGTWMPLQLPVPPIQASFDYRHLAPPTGKGHLTFDIWLQKDSVQRHSFGPTITHEIMIPLDYWGEYGAAATRNPGWARQDAVIDGIRFAVFRAPKFNGAWDLIVFEPYTPPINARTLDLSLFVNYLTAQGWATGKEFLVSVELGVEPVEGTGDLEISGYRVTKQ